MFSIEPAIVSNEPPVWMRVPPSQLSSTNFRIELWSTSVWSTKFFFANGETTSSGMRVP